MAVDHSYTLRPLDRDHGTLLEGAFRVHLTTKELKALKVVPGDLVNVTGLEGPKGCAIAWQVAGQQTNPGTKPIAKVSKLLRDKYDLFQNDRILIEKVEQEWRPIIAINIGLPDSPEGFSSHEDFLFWCRQALGAPYPM
jgi:AAA family ATPase